MNARRWLWVLLLCLPLHALAEIRVYDDRGMTLVLPRGPQRIVSLLPSLTESICALGGCDRLVGVDRFSNSPARVISLPKLGGLEDAQVERIVSLKPDVVLAAPSARVTDRLESLGLKVLVLESKTHADVKRALQALGQLLESPGAADATWARIEAAMVDASTRVPAALRGQRVYFEVDATPYAAGAGSFIGETLTRLSLGNIIAPELGPFPRLNPEFVVKARPDIIIAAQSNLNDMPKRPGWGALVALQHHRSCGFDIEHYELLIRPGPRMGEAALLLADCLAKLPELH
ncbi:MAG: helical backbone metal receptor [Rhizobacter sp.]